MKNRAFTAIFFTIGMFVFTIPAHAQSPSQPRIAKTLPFQGAGGRDVSESAWQSWQAPVGTVDPDRLIPSDSTDSTNAGLPQYHFDSLKKSFNDGKPIQEVEQSKPIMEVETLNAHTVNPPAPVLATTARRSSSDSKRIIAVAFISVALLTYRKIRRASRVHPPKPSFL